MGQKNSKNEMRDYTGVEDKLNFFDDAAFERMEMQKIERRKMLKITGAIAIGLALTGGGYKVYLDKQEKLFIEKVKALSSSNRVSEVIAKLDGLNKAMNKQNIEGIVSMSELSKEQQLAALFGVRGNISQIEKVRMDAFKSVLVELSNVTQHMNALDNKLKATKVEDVETMIKTRPDSLVYQIQLLEDLEKGFSGNPKDSSLMVFKNVNDFKTANENMTNMIKQIKDIKEEVMATVLAKVKSGDYSLDATTMALVKDVQENSKEKVSELINLRKEIRGTEFEKEFTDTDMLEAGKALSELENATIAKVMADKNEVQKLIEKVAKGEQLNEGDASPAIAASAPIPPVTSQVATNNQTQTHSHGWGPFEYYLLYNWLSGGSSSTPSIAASHTSSFANTSGKSLARSKNGAYIAPSISNNSASKVIGQVAPAPSMNAYNVRNERSYINSSMNNLANTPGRPNVSERLRNSQTKLRDIQAKGQRAVSARRAEVARAEAASRAAARAKADAAARASAARSTPSRASVSVGRGGGGGGGG